MYVGCSGVCIVLSGYFMREVAPSAKAGINGEPWGSVIITMAEFLQGMHKQSRGETASKCSIYIAT